MSFWRREVVEFALDQDAEAVAAEQIAWIAREPGNPRPYYQLGMLCRMRQRREAALGLLLEAVRLDEGFGAAHVALSQIYAVSGEAGRAWHHARRAEAAGSREAVEMLGRHGVAEPG